jgi:uncharacterized membrane protein
MSDAKDGIARYRTGRMEAFSDGVFAIAITLLVLEIGVPSDSEDDLLGALTDQWPSYLAYLVSFSTIGMLWLKHTVMTEYLASSTSTLNRLNLLLLLVVAFLPFPTQLVSEYVGEPDASRIATVVYGVNLLLTSVLISVLWRYAVRQRLVRPDVAEPLVEGVTRALTPGMAGYVVMIAFGWFFPIAAVIGYLLIALVIVVPLSALRRARPHA